MHEEAILLSPKTATYISLSKTRNKRLKHPYKSNCRDDYPEELQGLVPKVGVDLKAKYDSNTCKYLYHKYYSESDCKCINPRYLKGEIMMNEGEMFNVTKLCKNQTDCLLEAEKHATEKIKEKCTLECDTINFKTESSFMVWPTLDFAFHDILADEYSWYLKDIMAEKEQENKGDSDSTNSLVEVKEEGSKTKVVKHQVLEEKVANNYLMVNIFYGTHNVLEIKETEQFPNIFNFLNTLGGAVALWLGVTLVGMFESFEWVCRLLYTLIRTFLKKMGFMSQCCHPLPYEEGEDEEEIPMANTS